MVDARLRDGSRVNAVIAPVALRGASLTIRKFPQVRPGMDDLLRVGALDAAMRDFLSAAVVGRKNIIVSGGTGRSEEHTSELQSLMRISYAVFCLKKKTKNNKKHMCNHNHVTL